MQKEQKKSVMPSAPGARSPKEKFEMGCAFIWGDNFTKLVYDAEKNCIKYHDTNSAYCMCWEVSDKAFHWLDYIFGVASKGTVKFSEIHFV